MFMAEQDREATFYRTKKKNYITLIYVIYHISNRLLDFFWELSGYYACLKRELLIAASSKEKENSLFHLISMT